MKWRKFNGEPINLPIKDQVRRTIEAEIANPTPKPEPTIDQKLSSVGLSVADLKSALGLGTN